MISSDNWITIVGWLVTFIFGVLATLIVQRLSKTRKIIAWSVFNESDLLSESIMQEISTGFQVPVSISVNGINEQSLSTMRIKIGNAGNIEIENIKIIFNFGENAQLYVGRYVGDLGAYRDALHLEKNDNNASLTIKHINSKQSIEVEFLVGHYNLGDITVDMAAPGIILKKVENANFDIKAGILSSIGLGVMGIKYDPNATQTALLVEEIKKLRTFLSATITK